MYRYQVKLTDGTEFEGVSGFREAWIDTMGPWGRRVYKVISSNTNTLVGKRIGCYKNNIVYEIIEKK